jgi:hypothetical protein
MLAIKASPVGGVCGVVLRRREDRYRSFHAFSLKRSEMTTAIPCLGELIPCSAF